MAFSDQGYGDMFSLNSSQSQKDFVMQNMAGSIMRAAFGELVYSRFMNESRDAFGVGKGGTFTIPIVNNWNVPATVIALTAGTSIGIGTQHYDSVNCKMYEYGTGVGYETIADWMTSINNRQNLVNTLGIHIARMVNWLDWDCLQNQAHFNIECRAVGSYRTLYEDAGGTLRSTGANFGELADGALAYAYDTFRKSIAAPVTSRGMYVIVGNSRTFRNIKNGSRLTNAQLYSGFRGNSWQVLGDYMNFTFVETEELAADGTCIALAANAGGYGWGKQPTLTYYPDYGQDAGRLQAWKYLFYRGQDAVWRDKGTCAILIRTNSSAYSYGMMD